MLRRRRSPARRIPLVLLSLLAAAVPAARGVEPTALVVPLNVNGVERGDVAIALEGDDVLMRVTDLEAAGAAGARWDRQKLIARVASAKAPSPIEASETVWLSALKPLVDYRFDPNELSLRITFDPRLLASTELTADSLRPKGIVYSTDTSTFLNYALDSVTLHTPSLFGEVGHSFRGNLLYSSFSRSSDGEINRGLTNFTIDQRTRLRRITIGDSAISSSDPLGGAAIVGGVTASRNFSLDPYFIRQPSMALRGLALSPSTVDVYVNGQLVAQRQIPPGQFELKDVPLSSGAGNVQLVVRDAFGGEHTQSSSYYSSASILSPGLSQYTYSVGARRRDFLSSGGGYSDPALLADHRLGITDAFTGGARVEASRDLWSAGPSVALRTRLGDFSTSLAASSDHGETGHAYAFDYRYLARRLSYGAAIQGLSRHYANLSIKESDDRALLNSSAYLAFGIPYASAVIQWTSTKQRDTGTNSGISLSTSFPLGNRISAYAAAGIVKQDGKRHREYSSGVSIYAGRNITASANVSAVGPGTRNSTIDIQRPIPVGTGFGYRLRTAWPESGEQDGSGLVQYQSPYGRYQVAFDPYHLGDSPSLNVSGGLITERGRFLFTPPVQDSFALVRVPDVAGVRVYSSNQLIGRTDAHGDLLLPSLLAYYGNPIRIEDHDIPLDYQVGGVERIIAPPFRGGALVEFPVARVQTITGTVSVQRGAASIIPSYGQMTITRGDQSYESPVGNLGEFYFENVVAGKYSARVEWADGRCTFDIDAPSTKDSFINVGALTCKGSTP